MSPAEYSVRESARAKHVRLRISVYDGSLTVVVPRGFDRSQIPEIVQEKQRWIERARRRVASQRQQVGGEAPGALPERVQLRAIDEDWRLEYRHGSDNSVLASEQSGGLLVVSGAVDWVDGCHEVLRRWVTTKARERLVPWLWQLSSQHGLPVSRTAVRAQRTRWASCSQKGTISLNKKLLFIPTSLVDYVLVHELCHTAHFNHSPEFWSMVRQRVPGYKALDAEVRSAWRYVPMWMNGNHRP
jgi:predicted metal-dependent hydrolase